MLQKNLAPIKTFFLLKSFRHERELWFPKLWRFKTRKKSPFSDLSFLNTRIFIVFGPERMNVILCWPGPTNHLLLFVLIIKWLVNSNLKIRCGYLSFQIKHCVWSMINRSLNCYCCIFRVLHLQLISIFLGTNSVCKKLISLNANLNETESI